MVKQSVVAKEEEDFDDDDDDYNEGKVPAPSETVKDKNEQQSGFDLGHGSSHYSQHYHQSHHHHHQQQQQPELPRDYAPLRLRKDSNGSMRGAFTAQARTVHVPERSHHHHHHEQQKSPRKKRTTMTSSSSMVDVDVAALASTTMTGDEETGGKTTATTTTTQLNDKQAAFWKQQQYSYTDPGSGELMQEPMDYASDRRHMGQRDNSLTYSQHEGSSAMLLLPGNSPSPRASSSSQRRSHRQPSQSEHEPLIGSDFLNSISFSPGPPVMDNKNTIPHPSYTAYGTTNTWTSSSMAPPPPTYPPPQSRNMMNSMIMMTTTQDMDEYSNSDEESSTIINCREQPIHWCLSWLYLRHYDPTPWLTHDVEFDEDDLPYFPEGKQWLTLAGYVRHYLYNPIQPEFTSLQQFSWAVVIGVAMGIYTAVWKTIVETGVDFVWETVPEFLLEHGVFTTVHGWFPLYHYMWIVPTMFGAFLSYIFVVIPVKIPGQNEWIASLHKSGVQDYRTFWPLFILSTLGMLSGLSLGPELPLVLTSGMFGSWLGLICRQSMLQARVLNLTAASAAIGGFFGFPMAGALFVLELPHRSGLQYFEALTPSTISSIVAVITNRLIVNNDVTGYFKYPFLATSLPSSIFWYAIVYGLFGCAVGTGYLLCVLWCKTWVHDWFHAPHHDGDNHHEDAEEEKEEEPQHGAAGATDKHGVKSNSPADVTKNGSNFGTSPTAAMEPDDLLAKTKSVAANAPFTFESHEKKAKSILSCLYSFGCLIIPQEKYRAAAAGAVTGFICGWVAIFVPHTLFWGEAQLQNLIDKGRTPLPVFSDSTEDLVALGYCIIDPSDPAAIKAGFSVGCAALIAVSKTVVIGLSLGTGIIGGHFWGPLFVGCAASHFFSDIVNIVANHLGGFGRELAAYPCLVILCTMGAAHVVSFRAHMAIMLILTLTISAFSPEDGNPYYGIAGDYSAVFPLLVISVSLSMILSRDMFFYKEQRNRGDILATPEVLCEPGMQGTPLVVMHDDEDSDDDLDGDAYEELASVHSVREDTGSISRRSLQGATSRRSSAGSESEMARFAAMAAAPAPAVRSIPDAMTAQDIEDSFLLNLAGSHPVYSAVDPYSSGAPTKRVSPVPPSMSNPSSARASPLPPSAPPVTRTSPTTGLFKGTIGSSPVGANTAVPPMPLGIVPPPPMAVPGHQSQLSMERLDEILAKPLESEPPRSKHRRKHSRDFHRRTASLPVHFSNDSLPEDPPRVGGQVQVTTMSTTQTTITNRGRANSSSRQDMLVRISSFGEVDHQPSLLEQARIQAASMGHRRVPSLPRGRSSRKNSSSNPSDFGVGVDSGALAFDDFEHSFNNMVNSRGWNNQGQG